MFERSTSQMGFGDRVMMATGAGWCFLIAAIGIGGALSFVAVVLGEPRPFDWLLAANTVLCFVLLGGAALLVKVGLWMADDILAFKRRFSAPVRYVLTVVMILALAVVAIPLLPLVFGAALLGNAKEPD